MAFEIRYYNEMHNKDDIKFVTEFPCFNKGKNKMAFLCVRIILTVT